MNKSDENRVHHYESTVVSVLFINRPKKRKEGL